jgi:hypothetical protein
MKDIVIVSEGKERKGGLAALLRMLFPECKIRIVTSRDGALSPHGMDDDQARGCIHPFYYEQ